jgi:hypothetical protein
MAKRTQIVMGSQESYEGLKESAQNKDAGWWSCGKETTDGDLLFFYFKEPISAIVASATASGDARPGEDEGYDYVVGIENVKFFEKQITLQEMRQEIPEWGWPKQARNSTYLNEPIAKKLLKLAKLKGKSIAESPDRTSRGGAGFGTPEHNHIVEEAARKAVRLHFEKMGCEVVSRETENLGYDFDVTCGREELHLEVKGSSGSGLRFPITANEVACARSDSKFRLAVVTEANSDRKRVHELSRKEFLEHFDLKPLTFFAEAKRSLFA